MNLLRKFRKIMVLNYSGYMQMSNTSNTSITSITDVRQYKKRALQSESHMQLKQIWLEQAKKKNYNPEIFAITCRVYSRFMRKIKSNQTICLVKLLGINYQYLNQIDISNLKLIELIDLADFFNNATAVAYIHTKNENLEKFIDNLLHRIYQKLDECSTNRDISYISKATRCAEIYRNKTYIKFLLELNNKIDQIQMFQALSILNVILRGKHQSQVANVQIDILKKILTRCKDNNWGEISGLHTLIDLLNPIMEFRNHSPYIYQIDQGFKQIVKKVEELIMRDYQYTTTQQLIRICKFIQQANPDEENHQLIFKQIYNSVKEDGTTSLDTTFVLRYTTFLNLSPLKMLYPSWEQKNLKLFSKYYLNKDISCRYVFYGQCRLIMLGFLTPENQKKLKQYLKQNILITQQHQKELLTIQKCFNLIQVDFRLHQWDQLLQLIMKIVDTQASFQRYKAFYLYAFLLINAEFIKDMGIKINVQLVQSKLPAVKKNAFKTKKQSLSELNANAVHRLKKLYNQSLQMRSSCLLIRKVNYRVLQSLFKYLHTNCKYNETFQIFSSIEIADVQTGIILQSLVQVPIPRVYQKQAKRFLIKLLKNQEIVIHMYFSTMRTIRNINMRRSTLQAQFFVSFISKLPIPQKLQIYSDNTIIYFLMKFIPQYFLSEAQQILNSKYECQNLLIRSMSFMAQNSNNIKDALKFKEKLLSYQLKDHKMIEYLWNIFSLNGLISQKQYEDLSRNPKIQESSKNNVFRNLSNYQKILNDIYETTQFGQNESTKLRQYIMQYQQAHQKKQMPSFKFVRDMIRVVRHVNAHNKQIGKIQLKDIFAQPLITMAMKVNTGQHWAIEALALAYQMKWKSDRLFDKVVSVATTQNQWLNDYRAEDLLQLLINYPNQNKWNRQFINLLIKVTMYCQHRMTHLYKILQESDKLSLLQPNCKVYLQYLNAKFSQLETKPKDQKQSQQQL